MSSDPQPEVFPTDETDDAYARDQAADWVEWQDELEADRFGRNDPARTLCGVCNERPGLYVYGLKCRGCFEAQREERER